MEDFNAPIQPRLPEEFVKDADSGLNIIVSLPVGQSHLEYERIVQGKEEAQSDGNATNRQPDQAF
jgi:hypothetical protein